jgi:TonB family protein
MAPDTRLQPDSSKPEAAASSPPAVEPHFENDFAVLAARLSSQGGGGLPPEFSAELALEIVLNEIVEQACLSTGATGSAIVLRRDGEMVCRASSGWTAPDLGSRLDEESGLSGECIRTRETQRCDDALDDPRVDREASLRLGVRSVMIMPLLRGDELVGVFELFSSQPNAFGEAAEHTLQALGTRTLSSLERSTQPLQAKPEVPPVQPVEEALPESPQISVSRSFDWITAALGIAVLACAILLGILIGGHLKIQKAAARSRPAPAAASVLKPVSSEQPADNITVASKGAASTVPAEQTSPRKTTVPTTVPEGGLLIFENGKEVFRMPADNSQSGNRQPQKPQAAPPTEQGDDKAVTVSAAEAESNLISRVEPEYPGSARQAGIQGSVVLDIRVGLEGTVENVRTVSGPPELTTAAADAVKQWRFRPHVVNGRPTKMRTTLRLTFRLPS